MLHFKSSLPYVQLPLDLQETKPTMVRDHGSSHLDCLFFCVAKEWAGGRVRYPVSPKSSPKLELSGALHQWKRKEYLWKSPKKSDAERLAIYATDELGFSTYDFLAARLPHSDTGVRNLIATAAGLDLPYSLEAWRWETVHTSVDGTPDNLDTTAKETFMAWLEALDSSLVWERKKGRASLFDITDYPIFTWYDGVSVVYPHLPQRAQKLIKLTFVLAKTYVQHLRYERHLNSGLAKEFIILVDNWERDYGKDEWAASTLQKAITKTTGMNVFFVYT